MPTKKSPKQKPYYDGIHFDSMEEVEIYMWLQVCLNHGLIHDMGYHTSTFPLAEKKTYQIKKTFKKREPKYEERTLLHPHTYTPDFTLTYIPEDMAPQPPPLRNIWPHAWRFVSLIGAYFAHIEVKADYVTRRLESDARFSLNQKWMMQRHDIYVQKVQPMKLFKKTFLPSLARHTLKTGVMKAKYQKDTWPTINQFLERTWKCDS